MLTLFRNSFFLFLLAMTGCTGAYANEIYIVGSGDGNSLNVIQDGMDNYIDLSTSSFEDSTMVLQQNGDDNSVDLTISGGTGTGSSFYIYQNGDDNSYSANLWCNAAWCTMTVNQP